MKIKFSDASINKLEQKTRERMERVTRDKGLLFEVGELATFLIKYTVRTGKSPLTGMGFDKLSDAWKKERIKLEPKDDAFRQGKSNLTLSGQLMKSLTHRSFGNTVELFFTGTHKTYTRIKTKYKISRKKRVQSGFILRKQGTSGTSIVGKEIPNKDLANYVAERGRPFFGFNDFYKNKLLSQVKKVVIRYLRRNI